MAKLKLILSYLGVMLFCLGCDQKYIAVPELQEPDKYVFSMSEHAAIGDFVGQIEMPNDDSCSYEFFLVDGSFSSSFSIDSIGSICLKSRQMCHYETNPVMDFQVLIMHNFSKESLALIADVQVKLVDVVETYDIIIDANSSNTFDTYISSLNPTVNYSNSEFLVAEGWTYDLRSNIDRILIHFDLQRISKGAHIEKAILYLYNPSDNVIDHLHSQLTGPNNFEVVALSEYWSDSIVCWDNQPEAGSSDLKISVDASVDQIQSYSIDVTSLVNEAYNNPEDYFGWLIKLEKEEYYKRVCFASFENANASLRPKLNVRYVK